MSIQLNMSNNHYNFYLFFLNIKIFFFEIKKKKKKRYQSHVFKRVGRVTPNTGIFFLGLIDYSTDNKIQKPPSAKII